MSYLHVFQTASVVRADGTEEHGWMDPDWSTTELLDSRNDAGTILSIPMDEQDRDDQLRELLTGFRDNGDGTWYQDGEYVDPRTGDTWTYAAHLVEKYQDGSGYAERPYLWKGGHADYPHEPGTLYDCQACEAQCHCDDMGLCVHCASTAV